MTVKIFVGLERKLCSLHKGLLCFLAPYFAKAFNGSFVEGLNNEMYLPEEDPSAFDLFMLWLYRGEPGLAVLETSCNDRFLLSIMADKWCLTSLKRSTVNSLINWFNMNSTLAFDAIQSIVTDLYPSCLNHRGLRSLVSQAVHLSVSTGSFDQKIQARLYEMCKDNLLFNADIVLAQSIELRRRPRVIRECLIDRMDCYQ